MNRRLLAFLLLGTLTVVGLVRLDPLTGFAAAPRFEYTEASAPAEYAAAVTPADTDLAILTRGVYVGTTGNLVVQMKNSTGALTTFTFSNVPSGTLLPLRVHQVRAATTATNVVVIW